MQYISKMAERGSMISSYSVKIITRDTLRIVNYEKTGIAKNDG